MSKLTAVAATSHTISLTAMEEASRFGERTAGIDHMFLALVVNEQIAGQVLRSFDITLDAAREAIAEQHAEQLASIGIRSPAPAPDRITFHENAGYAWGPGALDVIRRSAEGKHRGDAAAVLRELLVEPSGLIAAVLHRLGTETDDVRHRLDEAERYPVHTRHVFDPVALAGTSECFVPAEPAEVWEMLADPRRMPEWEPGLASVGNAPAEALIGSRWQARALLQRPDGKPIRVKPAYRTLLVDLTDHRPSHRVEWRFSWPDAPKSNTRCVAIQLEPAAGGTRLLLSTAWMRNPAAHPRRIPLLRWAMRPLYRFAIWLQLMQLGASLSRAFR